MTIQIRQATRDDAAAVARLVVELVAEIVRVSGAASFETGEDEMRALFAALVDDGKLTAFLAERRDDGARSAEPVGVLTLATAHALYAGGLLGIIMELYVAPSARSGGVGRQLVEHAKRHAREAGIKRLEVTTPPIPDFERSLQFYEREGFVISGGRKLRVVV